VSASGTGPNTVGWRSHLSRLKGPASVIAFLSGFAFDALTLRRPDDPFDLFVLGVTLVALVGVVVLEQRVHLGRPVPTAIRVRRAWVHAVAQFLLGALLSATVVLYARSGGVDRTLGFVAGLVLLMLAVEFAGTRLRAEVPRVMLLCLAAFFLLLLVLPVIVGRLPSRPRLFLACMVAAGAIGLVVTAAVHADGPAGRLLGRVGRMATAWVLLCGALVGMERARVLPPVPLAVVDAAVVRDVAVSAGRYTLSYGAPSRWTPWRKDERHMVWQPGEAVWMFTAVFAPNGMTTGISHVWEHLEGGAWVVADRIPYPMTGGRDGGFRGYTVKRTLKPGQWRVRVESGEGRELVRVPFELVEGRTPEVIQRVVE
jgi:hypothetical protein